MQNLENKSFTETSEVSQKQMKMKGKVICFIEYLLKNGIFCISSKGKSCQQKTHYHISKTNKQMKWSVRSVLNIKCLFTCFCRFYLRLAWIMCNLNHCPLLAPGPCHLPTQCSCHSQGGQGVWESGNLQVRSPSVRRCQRPRNILHPAMCW